MITVNCPVCNASYKLDEAKIGPQGRKLKCAKCATIWVATVPEQEAARPAPQPDTEVQPPVAEKPIETAEDTTLPASDGEPEVANGGTSEFKPLDLPDMEHLAALRHRRVSRALRGETLWMLVGGLVVLAGAMAAVGVYWNTLPKTSDVVPPAVQTKALRELKIGYGLPPEGVVLRAVKGEVLDVSGDAVLNVSGMMTNLKSDPVAVSSLRLELVGSDDTVRDAWPIADTSGTLAPHAQKMFTVSLTGPSLGVAKGWRVVFDEAR